MDSITQLALGAAVGEATAGRQVGRRALLWGAIAGTIPDLDVFIPLGDAVSDFTYHRSFSHSLFVLAALTPVIVWLILKFHPGTAAHRKRWFLLVYLVFATHVLLDSFTVYGTQIFWPFVTTPMTWSTIFIIDPLYTLPLLVGTGAALLVSRRYGWGHAVNTIGLVLSTGYLLWTLGAKLQVEQVARNAFERQNMPPARILTTPTAFNSLLWRVLAVDNNSYYEGYYSVFDDSDTIAFKKHPRSLHLLEPLSGYRPVERLQWFTKDFYKAMLLGDAVVITDLRMGSEPDYVFRFKVGEMGNPHPRPAAVQQLPGIRDFRRLYWIWARIWDQQAGLMSTH